MNVLKVFKGTVYDATTRFSEDSAIDKQIKDRLEKMSGGIQNAHGEMTGQRVIAHLENSPVADTLRMRFGGSDATLIPVGDTAYVVSARADGGVNFVQNNGAGGRVVSGVDMAHDVASAAAAEALRRRQAA